MGKPVEVLWILSHMLMQIALVSSGADAQLILSKSLTKVTESLVF